MHVRVCILGGGGGGGACAVVNSFVRVFFYLFLMSVFCEEGDCNDGSE